MKYQNELRLPTYVVDWLKFDEYDHSVDPFTVSATGLMKPVRAHYLAMRHADELEMDVSELLAAKYGTAIHDSFSKIQTEGVLKEQRVTKQLLVNGTTYTISGKFDILELQNNKWTIRDIKTTSVWAYIYGGKDDDYSKQLSVYRWLLNNNPLLEGKELNDIACIDFLFTDWQSSKAKQDPDYPQHRINPGYKINLMTLAETEEYIFGRVSMFDSFRNVKDDDLPACSKEELWSTEDTFAVFSKENKRATKVCSSEQEAQMYIVDKKVKNAYIEFRPAKAKRCKYCAATNHCGQFLELSRLGLIELY